MERITILNVGRFMGLTSSHPKRQDVLIRAFNKIVRKSAGRFEFTLHLAGGVADSDIPYFNELLRSSRSHLIHFYPDVNDKKLQELFNQSDFYWHATGFGYKDGVKQEHFGITVLEAIQNGLIPVCWNGGGPREILMEDSRFLSNSVVEYGNKTLDILESDLMVVRKDLMNYVSQFTGDQFSARVQKLFLN